MNRHGGHGELTTDKARIDVVIHTVLGAVGGAAFVVFVLTGGTGSFAGALLAGSIWAHTVGKPRF